MPVPYIFPALPMPAPLRVAFAGTPEFAACALEAILDAGYDVPLVLTQPDRPAGRVPESAIDRHHAVDPGAKGAGRLQGAEAGFGDLRRIRRADGGIGQGETGGGIVGLAELGAAVPVPKL